MTRPFSELSQYPQDWPKTSGIRRTIREKGVEGKEVWDSVAILAHKRRCENPKMTTDQFWWFKEVLTVLRETHRLSNPDSKWYDIEDVLPCGCHIQVCGGEIQASKVIAGKSTCCGAKIVGWCCFCSHGCESCREDRRCTKCNRIYG